MAKKMLTLWLVGAWEEMQEQEAVLKFVGWSSG